MVATFLQNRNPSVAPPPMADVLDQPLYIVFGGRVTDPDGTDFADLNALDIRGIFSTYDAAFKAWRGASQMHVDEAFTKYVISRLR